MADYTLNVSVDRFESLAANPKAWSVVLPVSSLLFRGDTLTINEVDSLGTWSGRYMYGTCTIAAFQSFYNLPAGYSNYLVQPKSEIMAIYLPVLYKTNTALSLTGTTVETIIYSKLIVGGTFNANDIVRHFLLLQGTSNVTAKTCRIYFNTTATLTGATVVGQYGFTTQANGTGSTPMVRNMWFQNSLSSQGIGTIANNTMNDEAGAFNTPIATRAINFAIDQYFIITLQLASAADTITLLRSYGLLYR